LAVTYFEMRFGRRPFPGADPYELGMQHLRDAPDLAGAGGRESRVLLRALSKDPAKRYGSCREFVDALAAAIAPPPPIPERFPWALTVVALGLLLLVIVAIAAWLLRDEQNVSPPVHMPRPGLAAPERR
jgi:hypothetical protein